MARPQRVQIFDGKLMVTVNAADGPGFSNCYEFGGFWLEFPLFNRDDGTPATGDYRGLGTLIQEHGREVLVLGDPATQAYLSEYFVAPEATAESVERYNEFAAGFKAGATQGKRRKANASLSWKDGYEMGLKCRAWRAD